jgi:nucleoside-diphosphate-sugar epimerase
VNELVGNAAEDRRPKLDATPVLITGATGFIGNHLARRLVNLGAEVHALVRAGSDQRRLPADAIVHEHTGDIRDLILLMERLRPILAFHLATRFVGRHEPMDVLPLVLDNVGYSAEVFEALSRAGVRRVVTAGSAWQRAHDGSYQPPALYAAMKQAVSDILAYYAGTGQLRAITLVLHDTYGTGDRREKIIPLLERAAIARSALELSPGEQLLDLVHVVDVVDAFVMAGRRLLSESESNHEEFVVTSGDRRTLREIAQLHAKLSQDLRGSAPRLLWGARSYRTNEIMEPWPGGSVLPGWVPRIALSEGLRELIAAG